MLIRWRKEKDKAIQRDPDKSYTLTKIKAWALVYTLADRLAEVKVQRFCKTLPEM